VATTKQRRKKLTGAAFGISPQLPDPNAATAEFDPDSPGSDTGTTPFSVDINTGTSVPDSVVFVLKDNTGAVVQSGALTPSTDAMGNPTNPWTWDPEGTAAGLPVTAGDQYTLTITASFSNIGGLNENATFSVTYDFTVADMIITVRKKG
jgi:hypothetical protein